MVSSLTCFLERKLCIRRISHMRCCSTLGTAEQEHTSKRTNRRATCPQRVPLMSLGLEKGGGFTAPNTPPAPKKKKGETQKKKNKPSPQTSQRWRRGGEQCQLPNKFLVWVEGRYYLALRSCAALDRVPLCTIRGANRLRYHEPLYCNSTRILQVSPRCVLTTKTTEISLN